MMELKDQPKCGNPGLAASQFPDSSRSSDDDGQSSEVEEHGQSSEAKEDGGDEIVKLELESIDEWEIRRLGSMAARLLRDVKIT